MRLEAWKPQCRRADAYPLRPRHATAHSRVLLEPRRPKHAGIELGPAFEWRVAGCRRRCRIRCVVDHRQEYPLPTELNEAKNRHSCPRKRPMADLAPARRSCRRCREHCHTRQLHRSPETQRRLGQAFSPLPIRNPVVRQNSSGLSIISALICLACGSQVRPHQSCAL